MAHESMIAADHCMQGVCGVVVLPEPYQPKDLKPTENRSVEMQKLVGGNCGCRCLTCNEPLRRALDQLAETGLPGEADEVIRLWQEARELYYNWDDRREGK